MTRGRQKRDFGGRLATSCRWRWLRNSQLFCVFEVWLPPLPSLFLKTEEKRKKAVETTNIKTGGNGGNPTTLTRLVPVSLTHQLPSGNNYYEPL